ncbi:hypothetical protein [uncultured Corynebacterium sp.]|uniref:hypothetical protein n=1 Tax=uncultured Corynebacterium sp. TaxID=159447 RepID=UPI0025F45300|nr:hypothetical protein [uncultured Corynebacterium sp.]
MRIEKVRTKTHRVAYVVERSEYDAHPPVPSLLVDALPNTINPELEAVALFLIFGRWCGGEFTTPQKMGPNTAAAITRYSDIDLFCGPIEFYPKPLNLGTKIIRLGTSISDLHANSFIALEANEWNGSMRSTDSLAVSSNYSMFQVDENDVLPLVGLALLYAETLGADQLELPGSDKDSLQQIRDLLLEVRIGLKVG